MFNNKKALYSLLFTVFIDMLGVGIVAPVLAAIFFRPESPFNPLFERRSAATLYGLFAAAYPFGQFFGAPVLGVLSDKYGRKKLLLLSILGTFINYVLLAIGILKVNLQLILVAKLVDGFTGGNISVANSAIADISTSKDKTKNFGLIGLAFGMGFIFGPFFGGVLSNHNVLPWFNLATPFLFAAILSLINLILISSFLMETLRIPRDVSISFFTGIKNLIKILHIGTERKLLSVIFLVNLGTTLFTQFFQVYLIKKFDFNTHQIGVFFAYIGICIVVVQGVLLKPISEILSLKKSLLFSILGLAVIFPILLFPDNPDMFYFLIPLVALFMGITQPNLTTLLSDSTKPESQGEIMGVQQSMLSIAYTIPPLFSGILLSRGENWPIITAFIIILGAWLMFIAYYKNFRVLKPSSNFNN
jgi:MFS transporter, DHA1 family, tetracycline resistance protein